MNNSLSADLVIYSAGLIAVGLYASGLSPQIGAFTFVATITAAVLCLLWGILGLCGFQSRIGPIVTLFALAAVLLPLTVKGWLAVKGGNDNGKSLAALNTMLLGLAVGQLVNILQKRTGMFTKNQKTSPSNEDCRLTDVRREK